MIKIELSGKEFFVDDARQVINMGGPHIGDIGTPEDGLIASDCVLNNFILDNLQERLYFVKYHSTTNWRSGIFFTINFYDMHKKVVYEYDEEFGVVFIKSLIGKNQLEIFLSGHDQFPNTRRVFDLDKESFQEAIDCS